MKTLAAAAVMSFLLQTNTFAADAPATERGHQVFEYWCAPCHGTGPGHPGTAALAAKYKGARPGELEKRDDLPAEFIASIVRNGISVMPIFRKTEVSDADLAAISSYLNRRNKSSSKR